MTHPSKDTPSLSSSRSTRSTTSSRPTPPPSPERLARARVLTESSFLSPSFSRETKSSGSASISAALDFCSLETGAKTGAQAFGREETTVGTGGRREGSEEEGGFGPEIVQEPAPPPAATVELVEEEAGEDRGVSPTIKETMAKLQAFGKGGISVVWLKGTMAVSQIVALIVVLVLAHTTPSPTSPSIVQASACPARYPLQAWLIVHIIRVGMCWPTSVWLYVRRKKVSREERSSEGGDESSSDLEEPEARWRREREDSAATAFSGLSGSTRVRSPSMNPSPDEPAPPQPLTLPRLLDIICPKLSLACLFTTLLFFVLGNILVPLSAMQADCRHSAPLLWWGVLGGICVAYGLVLEIVVVVLIVGVGGWALRLIQYYLSPPAQPSSAAPLPAPPLETFLLFKIPLSIFIPLPTTLCPLASPDDIASEKNLRHPALYLPENRASCPICLLDFIPPNLREKGNGTEWEGGEVVRALVGCGHAFHPACSDPWLTGKNGRCPVCSKVVEVSEEGGVKRQRGTSRSS